MSRFRACVLPSLPTSWSGRGCSAPIRVPEGRVSNHVLHVGQQEAVVMGFFWEGWDGTPTFTGAREEVDALKAPFSYREGSEREFGSWNRTPLVA